LFTDFGGEENLAVNGYPRYEGDITGAPSNIAPGVTCTVYYTDFGNYRCGKVLLVGDVESLLIAGQEFCVDDICVYESTEVPPIECDHEVLFEDEVLGSAWGGGFGNVPGDTIITEDEISVTVDNFWDGYNWVFLNCFIDSAIPGYGVCDGQALFISNVLAGFEVPDLEGGPEVASVSFEFVDWDGIENLQVNGEAPYFGELTSAPVDIATGVTCSVDWWPIASGTAAGIVTLTGDVRSFAIGGQQFYMDNVCVTYATGTGIATSPLGVAPILNHNYPNPFNPKTTLSFSLAEQGEVRLSIHDVLGREVTVLVNGSLNAGNHEKVWDGRDHRGRAVSSGIYFARIEGGGEVQSRKLVLSK
ncbi:MAG: T9SS type A sorting domain-containing protein, partial [Candidatus Krumholzibacteria bacterium]|nr:T9SS type A sorting domain-containing protein [Candidatus Krumholzibacteria bacterium]